VVWARRLVVFLENVHADVPRFARIDDEDGSTQPFKKASWRPTDGFEQRPEATP
jgi:hypothetical protein